MGMGTGTGGVSFWLRCVMWGCGCVGWSGVEWIGDSVGSLGFNFLVWDIALFFFVVGGSLVSC